MIQKTEYIWMDGKLVKWDDARVHVLTHSLHYGVAPFEGIRAYASDNGKSAVFRLDQHVDRFFDSAHIMLMDYPYSRQEIKNAIVQTLQRNKLKAGYIRPIAFYGYGDMGLYVENNPVQIVIAAWPWGAYLGDEGLKNGIRIKISSYVRYNVNAAMSKAKIGGSYVNSILAKKESKLAGYDETILLDDEGYVAEGSGENVFIVKNGVLKTPPLTSILSGITRATIIQLAQESGIPVEEVRFTRDELYIADGAFLSGTAAEITPIREVDDRKIGTGRPEKITQRLQKKFFDIVRGKDKRHKDWLFYYTV
ncbi:MAG: branched-chain amino acid transaminase [Deltaproteobacteria bacterium]|nr:branched-chain amino acid transaminase [Deltaproteobacteria bacterium]